MALSEYKTEIIGISAEVAIADEYNVKINDYYRARSNPNVVVAARKVIKKAFNEYAIKAPIRHIAEGQNPIDFILSNQKTLSVKSNQRKLGKVAPQSIGQPTADTYWRYFSDFADDTIPDDYQGKAKMFKRVTINRIDEILSLYWESIFECDSLLHFYDFLDKAGTLNDEPRYIAFDKRESPQWDKNHIKFTQSLETWNESNTVKYNNISIGEFQVHNNRNCFKFRFNMDSIAILTEAGII